MFDRSARNTNTPFALALVLGAGLLASCSLDSGGLCSRAVSAPSYTVRFAQGLDNFSEDQYTALRLDTLSVRDTLVDVLEVAPDSAPAASVLTKVDVFIAAMDAANWDVTVALADQDANEAAADLGSATTLADANQVDALVIEQCGLPATIAPNGEPPQTLPSPWIAPPDATEPESPLVADDSEIYALGEVVGTLFALTLDQDQVMCLGEQLVSVVDKSDATSNAAQYKKQFQVAFDACGIEFTVPLD